jgi:hypothetical protein
MEPGVDGVVFVFAGLKMKEKGREGRGGGTRAVGLPL